MMAKIFSVSFLSFSFVFCIAVFFSGCTVPLCDTYTQKPVISFHISGPGFSSTYRSDDAVTMGDFINHLQLNMNTNTSYSFLSSISDGCGAHSLTLQFNSEFILSELKDDDGNTLTARETPFDKFVSVTGRIVHDSVKTSLIITGKFTTPDLLPNTGLVNYLYAYGYDYGGLTGSPNSAYVNLGFLIQAGIVPGETRL